MRLALVEDNQRLAELMRDGFAALGFAVDSFDTLQSARAALESAHYDLLVLDLGLPDGDGVSLIRSLRGRKAQLPILIVSARDAVDDRVRGLDAGADDYIVKPFEMAELAARIRALLRRPGSCLSTVLSAGRVALDTAAGEVRVDGAVVEMPPRELALLEQLLRRSGQVVRKSAIESSLYALSTDVTPNAVEAAVSRLRKRLAQAGAGVEIHTAHGIGYMLAAAGPD